MARKSAHCGKNEVASPMRFCGPVGEVVAKRELHGDVVPEHGLLGQDVAGEVPHEGRLAEIPVALVDDHRRNLPGNQAWYRQPANVAQAEATLRLQFTVFQLESPSGSYVKFAHMELIAEYYDIEDIASPSGLSRNLSDSSPQADRSGAPAGIQRADDAECHSSTSNTTQECGHLPRPSISVR